jgi:hypothetical protein
MWPGALMQPILHLTRVGCRLFLSATIIISQEYFCSEMYVNPDIIVLSICQVYQMRASPTKALNAGVSDARLEIFICKHLAHPTVQLHSCMPTSLTGTNWSLVPSNCSLLPSQVNYSDRYPRVWDLCSYFCWVMNQSTKEEGSQLWMQLGWTQQAILNSEYMMVVTIVLAEVHETCTYSLHTIWKVETQALTNVFKHKHTYNTFVVSVKGSSITSHLHICNHLNLKCQPSSTKRKLTYFW